MTANDNGHGGKPPLPFRAPAGVPIIGQPFTVKGGYATALIQCQCEAREPVLLLGNAPAFCAGCHRGFIIVGFSFDARVGQIQVNVGLVQGQPSVPPDPAGVSQ